jgi:hypothetical protein
MTDEGDKLSDDEIRSNPPGYTASEAMGDTDSDDQDSDSDDSDSDSDDS